MMAMLSFSLRFRPETIAGAANRLDPAATAVLFRNFRREVPGEWVDGMVIEGDSVDGLEMPLP
jgi:hypothetical protein